VSGDPHGPRVIDEDDTVAGGVVRRYLERTPELAARLHATEIPVVVVAPDVDDQTGADFFDRVQAALTASVARHGRALYVASVHARPLIYAARPLPAIDPGRGAFVGYFAVGEGGALFVRPDGQVGSDPALFDAAISAMMATPR
jgi:hypothetical protein